MRSRSTVKLNFKSYGSGPPLIIVHGLFGMLDNWKTIGRQLGTHFTVYLLDMRNHGRSPHTNEFDYELMALDVLEFMDDQWMHQDVIIMGHSMGGKVAMHCVGKAEDRFRNLIIVDMSSRAQQGQHQQIIHAMLSLPVGKIKSPDEADIELKGLGISEWPIRQFLLKNLKRKVGGGYEWKMNLEVLSQRYEEILHEVSGQLPIYDGQSAFISGERSNYIQELDRNDIGLKFPNTTFFTIENAGHWVHADNPDSFLRTVEGFLGINPH